MTVLIRYKKGYKYKLVNFYNYETELFVVASVADWVYLDDDGLLMIRSGYAWDGASGAIDTKSIMRASLVHDALYQLMREGGLLHSYRKAADKEFYRIMREDGMWWIRAQYIYWAVRLFGKLALKHDMKVQTAP